MKDVQSHVALINPLPADPISKICTPHDTTAIPTPQETFPVVNEYTEGFPGNLRPGESLGVHLGLIQELLAEGGGEMVVTVS